MAECLSSVAGIRDLLVTAGPRYVGSLLKRRLMRFPSLRAGRGRLWANVVGALALAGFLARARDMGRYAFWNDEAWVALSTRVDGLEQFWLSLSVTPVLWAATLRAFAAVPTSPEIALRLLPLLFGMLTLWAAYRLGSHFAGHPSGGAAAVAAVASDPVSVFYSHELKHYTAETFFCVVAFWLAGRAGERGRSADAITLALVLAVGAPFASTQLLVAPPLFAALLVAALLRGDRHRAVTTTALAVAVGLWSVVYFHIALAPRMHESLVQYWDGAYVPAESLGEAASFVVYSLHRQLQFTWGAEAVVPALAVLVATLALVPRVRTLGFAAILFVLELAIVSRHRALPFDESRVMLFALTLLHVLMAAAIALAAVRLWSRRGMRSLVLGAVAFFLVSKARNLERSFVPHEPEDLGTLVTRMEQVREPSDTVLLYDRSGFVYAYYQRRPPRLLPDARAALGFRVALDDARLFIVGSQHPEAVVAKALARGARVWLLGSRFRGDDERRITDALATRARVVDEWRAPRALAMLAVPDGR